LSLVLTKDAGTTDFSGINALAARLTRRVGPVFTAALERIADRNPSVQACAKPCAPNGDELRTTLMGTDDQNEHFRRENASLRAILAKTQADLARALQQEQCSRFLAFHDDLTALPNRRFFLERLRSALTQDAIPANVAVIYLDLDGFKALNDTYGHANGDALLGLIATRLAHALRAEDLVSRIGGDEFACLITGVSSRERLQHIALTLFAVVSAPFKIGALTLHVRPSIGVAMCPMDGTTVEALMQAADAAMYGAKRNRTSFSFSNRPHAFPH
jgi:diguanylate cyclase (GGDEF)-like protein